MKIAFDGRILGLTLTGVAEQLINLVKYLINQKVECFIIGPAKLQGTSDLKGAHFLTIERPRKIDLQEVHIENYILPKLVAKISPDIYHCSLNWGIPKNLPCKTVLTIHDVIPFKILEALSDWQFKLYKNLINNSVKRASKVITISNFSKKDIIETLKVNQSKIKVIYNGLTIPEKPKNLTQKLKSVKEKLNIKNKYFIAVGGFFERKNMPRIIEALALLKKKTAYGCQLIIPGKNEGTTYLDKQVDQCRKIIHDNALEKDVILPGYLEREDLEALILGSTIVLYPSLYEGFGLPILEAMAADVPVITSNITALPEVAAGAAHMVNPYDFEEIFFGMKKILEDKNYLDKLIKAGKKRILDFSWNKMGGETLSLYKGVLKA